MIFFPAAVPGSWFAGVDVLPAAVAGVILLPAALPVVASSVARGGLLSAPVVSCAGVDVSGRSGAFSAALVPGVIFLPAAVPASLVASWGAVSSCVGVSPAVVLSAVVGRSGRVVASSWALSAPVISLPVWAPVAVSGS